MDQERIQVVAIFDNVQPNLNDTLEQCFEWIIWLDYSNVVIAFANRSEEFIDKFRSKLTKKIKRLQIFNVPNCQSPNDILRDLQNNDIIKSNFLLIYNGIALSSSNLTTEIENFKIRRKQNKNLMATIIFEESKTTLKRKFIIGYQSTSNKLLYYDLKGQKGKMRIPKSIFLNEAIFRSDLIPTGLWICGHEFSGQFAGSDTHDFRTLEDIIQNILNNEEFLGQEIYVEILPPNSMTNSGNALQIEKEVESEESSQEENNGEGEIDDEEEEEVDITYQGNNAAFHSQVLELMEDFVGTESKKKKPVSKEQFEQLKLEINGLKFANNISIEEMPRLLFLAFLSIPKNDKWLNSFKELFKEWSNFWLVYFKKSKTRIAMLHAIEEFVIENEQFRRIVPNLLHWLNQDEEFIEDEQIVEWYSSLQKDSSLRALPKLAELVQWLQEADEDDDEGE